MQRFACLLLLIVNAGAALAEEKPAPVPPAPAASAAPAPADLEAGFLKHIRQLTFAGSKNGEAYFSPDGDEIVFQGVRETGNPFYQIYCMNLKGDRAGAVQRISSGVGRTTCAFFHPKKKRMIFSTSHLDPLSLQKQKDELEKLKSGPPKRYAWDFDPELDIFETDLDGGNSIQLTAEKGYDAEGSYSPDGKQIVFCSMRDAGDGEIYVMNADGSQQTRLTHEKGYDGGPFFSPDGKKIVWRHFIDEAQKCAEVWTMNADGSGKQQITNLNAISWAPYWHPNGEWIIFASNGDDPAFELYAVRADGSQLTRLTYTAGFDGLPVVSPDGQKLLWTSNRGGNKSQLFIADLALPGLAAPAANDKSKPEAKSDDLWKRWQSISAANRDGGIEHFLAREFKQAGLLPTGKDKRKEETEFIFGPSVSGWRPSKSGAATLVMTGTGNAGRDASGLAALLEAAQHSDDGLIAVAAQDEELPRIAVSIDSALKNSNTTLTAAVCLQRLTAPMEAAPTLSAAASALLPTLIIRGTGSSSGWPAIAERLAAQHPAVRILLEEDPAGAPELASTIAHKIPSAALEMLLPPTRITLDGEEATLEVGAQVRQAALLTQVELDLIRLLQRGEIPLPFTAYDAVAVKAAADSSKRAYLGTVPEYNSTGAGVKLKGVRDESPAQKAGVQGGDTIVELGGKPIKDVEGYLQVLESLKPGEATTIKVQREGKELDLPITPGAR